MGGNALKTIETTRKIPVVYKRIKLFVLKTLEYELCDTGMKWCVPHEVPGKTSYGDLDVLITLQNGFDIRKWILATFKPDELVSNGGVYSFNITCVIPALHINYDASDEEFEDYDPDAYIANIEPCPAKDFQVDIITTPAVQFAIHNFFLSWGDCGMLIGQITHATGLRFGQQGLFTSISMKPGTSDDIILSNDPEKICEFIGLNYTEWRHGFGSEGHIFRWLCQSPYIHFVKFNCSRHSRGMYLRFIDYVKEALEPPKRTPNIPALDAIITYFDKQTDFAAIKQKQANNIKRSEKFGSHLFLELGVISGDQLGNIINGFKCTIPGDFKEWVLATDDAEIQSKVSEYLVGLLPHS